MEELVLNKANDIIYKYKLKEKDKYNLIFDFCSKNDIIISKLPEKDLDKFIYTGDFIFTLFSTTPKKHAIQLSDEIYKKYTKFVTVNMFLNNKEIIIVVDNKRLIQINNFFIFENLKNLTSDILKPRIDKLTKFITYDNKKLRHCNDLVELFHLTHELYEPSKYIKQEFENAYNILDKLLSKTGNFIPKISRNDLIQKIKDKINNDKMLNPVLIDDKHKLIMIIPNSFNGYLLDIVKDLTQDDNLKYKYSNVYIFNDFRFKRFSLSINGKDLINIYNSIDYELYPIANTEFEFFIPHPLVIIRFILFNIISGKLFDKFYNDAQEKIELNKLKELNIKKEYNNIFFYGVFRDQRIDKFKINNNVYRPDAFYN